MQNVSLRVLTSPGCVHCHEFLKFWDVKKRNWPNVRMQEVSIMTLEGQQTALDYQIFASPGIMINDELFDSGGFNKKRVLQKLTELSK